MALLTACAGESAEHRTAARLGPSADPLTLAAPLASTAAPPEATATVPPPPSRMVNGMQPQPLGPVAHSFAAYLTHVHPRIHVEFADKALVKLATLPATDPLNDLSLATMLELTLDPKDGHLVKVGIVRPSGRSAFDALVLDSVQRAQPFGAAPAEITSADGNVYVRWMFHRDQRTCAALGAEPYLLKP